MTALSYSVAGASAATGLSVAYLNEAIRVGKLAAKTTTQRTGDSSRNGKRVILASELERFVRSLEDAS